MYIVYECILVGLSLGVMDMCLTFFSRCVFPARVCVLSLQPAQLPLYDAVETMDFLDAVVKETLRLNSPTPKCVPLFSPPHH